MLLYKLETVLTPGMTSGHYRFPFTIDKAFRQLRFHYVYAPKRLEDRQQSLELVKACYARYGFQINEAQAEAELPLNNLITLSVDSPEGLAGTAHRHADDAEYTIGPTFSSPGFHRMEIVAGEWAVTLSAHAVLSEKVVAEVSVYGD
jgi:hypothetical protein